MAITYSAQAGTTVTTHALQETLGDQSQQTGNNTIVISDTLGNAGNGQIGTGTNGIGDTFVGRRIIVDEGLSTEQVRKCTADAAGTTTTRILTVDRDWDTNPVITTDDVAVPYEPGDIEDGGAGGGINLNAKSGLFELSNELHVTGGLEILAGQALESSDEGATISNYIESGGRVYGGYDGGNEAYINGGISTQYNGANGEPSWQIQSGGRVDFYDMVFWAQLQGQQFENASGSDARYYRCKWINLTDELHLFDSTIIDCSAVGKGATTDIVRVDSGTSATGLILSTVQVLDTVADTVTETITLEGVLFSGVPGYVDVRQNKTWNLIDPVWDVTTYTDLTWTGTSTGNELNDKRSVKPTVQTADGTKLQNALINIYEHTILADLVLEAVTDVNGLVDDSFTYKKHATNSATTTYGGHALQCGKWLYKPFVSAQTSTDNFLGAIVLSPDANIVQTTQATAETAGATVTWNEDTNASSVISFTGGTGTLAVGNTVTGGTSTADGIVTEILDGNSTAGEIHLKTRDANAFSGTETLSNGAGWTATLTASSEQRFSVWIDCQTLSLQTIYDYLAAIQNKTTLTADGELIWEWCRSAQTQPLYATGSSFYTERSNSLGIFLVDIGGGTLDYATDDAGVTWSPPASVTVTVKVIDKLGANIAGAQVSMYLTADDSQVMLQDTSASGIATTNFTDTTPADVYYRVRKASPGDTKYINDSATGTIETGTGFSSTRTLTVDTNNNA